MPMAMIVTRNVEARYRGFLASVMLEVAPGVYIAPDLSAAVRTRGLGCVVRLVVVSPNRLDCDGLARRSGCREPPHRDTGRGAQRDRRR